MSASPLYCNWVAGESVELNILMKILKKIASFSNHLFMLAVCSSLLYIPHKLCHPSTSSFYPRVHRLHISSESLRDPIKSTSPCMYEFATSTSLKADFFNFTPIPVRVCTVSNLCKPVEPKVLSSRADDVMPIFMPQETPRRAWNLG